MSIDEKLKELDVFEPSESIAKAIDKLSSTEKIKLLSSLNKQSDVFRFALIFNVAEELNLDFLKNFGNDMLMLRVSLKGRGRKDIVEVVKQPLLHFGEGLGDKIKSFVRSE